MAGVRPEMCILFVMGSSMGSVKAAVRQRREVLSCRGGIQKLWLWRLDFCFWDRVEARGREWALNRSFKSGFAPRATVVRDRAVES